MLVNLQTIDYSTNMSWTDTAITAYRQASGSTDKIPLTTLKYFIPGQGYSSGNLQKLHYYYIKIYDSNNGAIRNPGSMTTLKHKLIPYSDAYGVFGEKNKVGFVDVVKGKFYVVPSAVFYGTINNYGVTES